MALNRASPQRLYIDLETYSALPLPQCGLYKYAEQVEIMLIAWAIDDGPVRVVDLAKGHPVPQALMRALFDPQVEIWAHNAMFDRTMLNASRFETDVRRWRCTMAHALAHSLPAGLDKLCEALRIPQALSKQDGRKLIQLFCKPRPANHKLERATPETHPFEWAQFVDYAGHDIDAMRACLIKMPHWNMTPFEIGAYHRDQAINDRGVAVDVELCEAALIAGDRIKSDAADDVLYLTDGDVQKPTQVDKLLTHILAEYGIELPNLQARTVETRLADESLPEPVKELLLARVAGSKSSSSKYKRMLQWCNTDRRARGLFQFAGAGRTNRWAGRGVQPHNLMRTPKFLHNRLPYAVDTIKAQSVDLVFSEAMTVIAACVRPMFVASPGKKLVVADLANIEGRVMACAAGEEWKVQAFRDFDSGVGEDLYILGYSRSFGVSIASVKADERSGGKQRLLGKVQELSLQYQGAVGAFQSMGQVYGVTLPDKTALTVVKAWRAANPAITSWWYELERTVKQAVRNKGRRFHSRVVSIQMQGNWLVIRLPSGRYLSYPGMRITEDDSLEHWGLHPYTKKWTRLNTYGGKLAENIVQAIARDVLAEGMQRAEHADYPIVLHVHDELAAELDENDPRDHTNLATLMAQSPDWMPDLPTAAAGYTATQYRKD